jgi:cysteine sulfinate desulfinase/cysteine desulfurase-like protein
MQPVIPIIGQTKDEIPEEIKHEIEKSFGLQMSELLKIAVGSENQQQVLAAALSDQYRRDFGKEIGRSRALHLAMILSLAQCFDVLSSKKIAGGGH